MPDLRGQSSTRDLSDRYFSGGAVTHAGGFDHAGKDGDDEFVAMDDEAAPPYERIQRGVSFAQGDSHAEARITREGRVDMRIGTNSNSLSKFFAPAQTDYVDPHQDLPLLTPPFPGAQSGHDCPALNVVMQLVGSRGDIQPFVSVGLQLQAMGHRVRIASHPNFQSFVEDAGLEFFSIGGDPTELMAYMVRNAGLLPDFHAVINGDVRRKRKAVREVMEGCWRSCIEAGNGINADPKQWRHPKPFVADAIISNPPTFSHTSCAEKIGAPLHIMFTMPWSPTQAFSHPLSNIQASSADTGFTNYASHVLVEMVTWQGVGNIVNSFRRHTLGLEHIDSTWAPGMVTRLKIPHTYCWSPSLISKPRDWGEHIKLAGFSFLPSASSYVPPQNLISFIEAGSKPVYIGFGSIVVNDPEALTTTIFGAIRLAGVRAILCQGWGGLGRMGNIPSNVFILGDCPHDWLFKHVACVVHHGGAGTTAAGLAAGKPSVVVPFFGDQEFWGKTVAQAGAGPQPIPFRTLSSANLAAAIVSALEPAVSHHASLLATKMRAERGAETAAQNFQDQLPLRFMGCCLAPRRTAVWRLRPGEVKMSALAAIVLRKEGLIRLKDLELYRPCEYELNHGPWEPVSGGALAISSLFYNVFKGFGEIGSDLVRLSEIMESSNAGNHHDSLTYSTSSPIRATSESSKSNKKAVGIGSVKGIARIVKATVRSPMTFTFAMAQGAHNAPRLWGDRTVRSQDKITGVGSGIVAAGKELYLGTYDGITGLFVQPYIGARDEGVLGAAKGLAKGVAGTPVKFFAAMSGSVGYSLKGLDVEISKIFSGRGSDVVQAARIAQGEQEYSEATEAMKNEIIKQWHMHMKSVE